MTILTIGETNIPYKVYYSPRTLKRYVEVKPDGVRLTMREGDTDAEIEALLKSKKRWIYDQYDRMREKLAKRPITQRYVSGAKIPYRGRMTMLDIKPSEDRLVNVHFRNKFHIDVPRSLDEDMHDILIEDALRLWLKKRVREDVKAFTAQYSNQTGLKPRSVIVKDQRRHWGLCGKDGKVYLNWNLVFAPKPVLEYAVVHEMCHLRYDDHGHEFWGLVEAILPDYANRKAWLDQNEHMLSLNLSSLIA